MDKGILADILRSGAEKAAENEGVLVATVIGEATSHGAMWVELVE